MAKNIFKLLLYFFLFYIVDLKNGKKPVKYNVTREAAKYDNPNFIRDRYRDEIFRPQLPTRLEELDRKKFNPAWMDYCDPYHCNDYHKIACGLHRKTMRFKWFQSGCHIALHNFCSQYRGSIKYDTIDPKYCTKFMMHLRLGCPSVCDREDTKPVCGISSLDNHVVLFRDKCAFHNANCRDENLNEYDEVDLKICSYYF